MLCRTIYLSCIFASFLWRLLFLNGTSEASTTGWSQVIKDRDCIKPMSLKGQNLQDNRPFGQVKPENFVLFYSVESLASGLMEGEEMDKNSSINMLFLEGGVASECLLALWKSSRPCQKKNGELYPSDGTLFPMFLPETTAPNCSAVLFTIRKLIY